MYWQDILIDRPLSVDEISRWLSEVFDLPLQALVVAPSEAHLPLRSNTAVLAEFSSSAGDFPFHLQVFTRREDLDATDPKMALQKLGRDLAVNILMSDDTTNPYRMILVRPDGETVAVHLDADALDDRDSFVIAEFER